MNNELIEMLDHVISTLDECPTKCLLETCKSALTEKREDEDHRELEYHLLASEMVYEGNSVQHWRNKALAYKECAGVIFELKQLLGVETPKEVLAALTQQQEAEPAGKAATYYAISSGDCVQFDTNTGQLEIYETEEEAMLNCSISLGVIAVDVRRHPPKPAAQPQVPDSAMTVGTRYEYTKIGSAEQKWWGCVLVGFDGGHPLIRTDAGHYHLRPLTEYRFRAISAAKEEGK